MKLRTLVLLSALTIGAAAVQPALATTPYSQPPTQTDGFQYGWFSSDIFIAADDFTLASGGTIADVAWSGDYLMPGPLGGTEVVQAPEPTGATFTIDFYSDAGTGIPGTLLSSSTTFTGAATGIAPLSSPFVATAGTEYWISIYENSGGAQGILWFWDQASGGDDADAISDNGPGGFVPATSATVLGGGAEDLAFSLFSSSPCPPAPETCSAGILEGGGTIQAPPTETITPEPSSLLLLGTGIFGIAAFSRRRIRSA